ncbi:MAG TPA: coenzyme F420-0:L-glutamate ligase [Candidatus Paceibacterota bacterium]|nr:coenzyme F420-0:L-glutamate ligase [Candidatus Paceibacterota bacterium]
MKVEAIKTRIFSENEDLVSFILKYVKKLPERSLLVVTSKIVALSEGRTISLDKTLSHEEMRTKIIKSESDYMIRTKFTWLTIKDGMVMASAGIDESNADGKIILLPKDSFKSAEIIRKSLQKKFNIKNLGILITDSRVFPLRAGVVGVALGYAGFKGVRDYRGTKDIFGRRLEFSRTDVADSLATVAVLCMGEGKEQQPLAIITGAPVMFTKKINKKELKINPKEDLYLPLFRSILKK